MNEFVSELEKILPAIELNLPATPGFGPYKKYLAHALPHPAKANTKLIEFLVLNFTNEGDTILDPMAGSGSTGVVAALYNRNAVCVDIEPKFYGWMELARKKVEQSPTLLPKGKIVNILGDARRLSELLSQVDVAITSPPYSNVTAADNPNVVELQRKGWVKGGDMTKFFPTNFSEENIGRLPLGNVDTIITSPPYSDSKKGNPDVEKMVERWDKHFKPEWNSWGRTWSTEGRKRGLEALGSGYGGSKENIGNLPHGNIDTIITSPPYLNVDNVKKDSEEFWKKAKEVGSRWGSKPPKGTEEKQMVSSNNISNMPFESEKKETYLSAMFKVYSEMFKVLKPGGLAIVIVKPFIRNRRVVDLPYHTYLLMQRVGFELEKLFKLRLKQYSFWRILYYRRFPNVPRINHEYVIVARKGGLTKNI